MLLDNIEHVAVLIHGPPALMTFTMNGEEGLIEILLVNRFGAPAAELIGICLPELSTPRPLPRDGPIPCVSRVKNVSV
jgi:hypothetical protein